MSSKSLTRGLIALPVAALAVGMVALAASASAGSSVVAPSVGYAVSAGETAHGLAPTTTSRDWQETGVSVVRPRGGRF